MRKIGVFVALVVVVVTVSILLYGRRSAETARDLTARQATSDAVPVSDESRAAAGDSGVTRAAEARDGAQPVSDGLVASALARYRNNKSPCTTAMEEAAARGEYFFLFFYASDDEQTSAMREVYRSAMNDWRDRADGAEIDIASTTEVLLVNKYQVRRAPMPLVLALAPGGAVTGGFPQQFTVDQLETAFASPCMERSLKALQDRKLVFVCVQNGDTDFNELAMQGVCDFKAEPGFGPSTEIVMVDPADPEEARFLGDLQVDPATGQAVTVCLVPPGQAVARFVGATQKDTIVSALVSSKSGCGPSGCGPGGCGK